MCRADLRGGRPESSLPAAPGVAVLLRPGAEVPMPAAPTPVFSPEEVADEQHNQRGCQVSHESKKQLGVFSAHQLRAADDPLSPTQ